METVREPVERKITWKEMAKWRECATFTPTLRESSKVGYYIVFHERQLPNVELIRAYGAGSVDWLGKPICLPLRINFGGFASVVHCVNRNHSKKEAHQKSTPKTSEQIKSCQNYCIE
jgi:hypothetical protein